MAPRKIAPRPVQWRIVYETGNDSYGLYFAYAETEVEARQKFEKDCPNKVVTFIKQEVF